MQHVLSQNLVDTEFIVSFSTFKREEYEALLKREGVEIKDEYKKQRDIDEAAADPSKVLVG